MTQIVVRTPALVAVTQLSRGITHVCVPAQREVFNVSSLREKYFRNNCHFWLVPPKYCVVVMYGNGKVAYKTYIYARSICGCWMNKPVGVTQVLKILVGYNNEISANWNPEVSEAWWFIKTVIPAVGAFLGKYSHKNTVFLIFLYN
jgi:hypothetical protein